MGRRYLPPLRRALASGALAAAFVAMKASDLSALVASGHGPASDLAVLRVRALHV